MPRRSTYAPGPGGSRPRSARAGGSSRRPCPVRYDALHDDLGRGPQLRTGAHGSSPRAPGDEHSDTGRSLATLVVIISLGTEDAQRELVRLTHETDRAHSRGRKLAAGGRGIPLRSPSRARTARRRGDRDAVAPVTDPGERLPRGRSSAPEARSKSGPSTRACATSPRGSVLPIVDAGRVGLRRPGFDGVHLTPSHVAIGRRRILDVRVGGLLPERTRHCRRIQPRRLRSDTDGAGEKAPRGRRGHAEWHRSAAERGRFSTRCGHRATATRSFVADYQLPADSVAPRHRLGGPSADGTTSPPRRRWRGSSRSCRSTRFRARIRRPACEMVGSRPHTIPDVNRQRVHGGDRAAEGLRGGSGWWDIRVASSSNRPVARKS